MLYEIIDCVRINRKLIHLEKVKDRTAVYKNIFSTNEVTGFLEAKCSEEKRRVEYSRASNQTLGTCLSSIRVFVSLAMLSIFFLVAVATRFIFFQICDI